MKETDVSSYADDNTRYRTAETIDEIIKLWLYNAVQMVLSRPNENKY